MFINKQLVLVSVLGIIGSAYVLLEIGEFLQYRVDKDSLQSIVPNVSDADAIEKLILEYVRRSKLRPIAGLTDLTGECDIAGQNSLPTGVQPAVNEIETSTATRLDSQSSDSFAIRRLKVAFLTQSLPEVIANGYDIVKTFDLQISGKTGEISVQFQKGTALQTDFVQVFKVCKDGDIWRISESHEKFAD